MLIAWIILGIGISIYVIWDICLKIVEVKKLNKELAILRMESERLLKELKELERKMRND